MTRLPKRITREAPDFNNLQMVLKNKKPGCLPFFEMLVDVEIMQIILDHPVAPVIMGTFGPDRKIKKEEIRQFNDSKIQFYYKMGYDYVPAGPGVPFKKFSRSSPDPGRRISEEKRIWQDEHSGPIGNWKDFEGYSWPTIADVDFSSVEYLGSTLPEGMKLVAGLAGIFEHVSWLTGVEKLCYLLYDEPELVAALFRKVGSLWLEVFQVLGEFDNIGALNLADDLGFSGGTFLPPGVLREHLFPWYSQTGSIARKANKPLILHACGNVKEVMPDVIASGVSARHSFEDKIEPIWEAKQKYGAHIGLLGGVDVNLLAASSEPEVRQRVRFILERCADKGYALGSGNSITDYMKVENYLAMLDEGMKFREGT